MYTFDLGDFHLALKGVRQGMAILTQRIANEGADATVTLSTVYSDALKNLESICRVIHLTASLRRIARVRAMLKTAPSVSGLYHALLSLDETVEDELTGRMCYWYPTAKADLVAAHGTHWATTINQFPSAHDDLFDGIDCFGCGKHTASVFHMMRVAEYGLRAIAQERKVQLGKGKPLEWGTWQEIINGLDNATKQIMQKKAGPAKDEALAFYSGLRGEMIAFKDVYRNRVMHTRGAYSEAEALRAINQVHDFMERVCSRLSEASTRQIRWNLRS